ncbi:cobalamin biosynthesis protein [Glaciecola siphonariae]|uniref:Cobalamin biosynthesis protein n=1 Tax=Glaciecola siphonariae TaxID=521012 RepID=A0ABV9M0X5_9ALTE
MDELIAQYLPAALSAWFVLLIAWLAEKTIPVASWVDPIGFFRFVCERMAKKVLPRSQQTQQHYISGALAVIVLIAPVLLCVFLIREFAYYPLIFDALIIYLCLQFTPYAKLTEQCHKALNADKKQLAKSLLNPSTLRQTGSLSSTGLIKATIEMFCLRIVYQQIVVMFWYLALGPIAVLFYRLCYEAHQSWNTKIDTFQAFGWFSHWVCFLFQYVPVRCFALLLHTVASLQNIGRRTATKSLPMSYPKATFWQSNGGVILGALSGAINRTTSGPVKYHSSHNGTVKIRRVKFLGRSEPLITDILLSTRLCNHTIIAFMWVLLLCCWVFSL